MTVKKKTEINTWLRISLYSGFILLLDFRQSKAWKRNKNKKNLDKKKLLDILLRKRFPVLFFNLKGLNKLLLRSLHLILINFLYLKFFKYDFAFKL